MGLVLSDKGVFVCMVLLSVLFFSTTIVFAEVTQPVRCEGGYGDTCSSTEVCDTAPDESHGSCAVKKGAPCINGKAFDCATFTDEGPLGCAYDARLGQKVCWPNGPLEGDGYCDSTREDSSNSGDCVAEEVPEEETAEEGEHECEPHGMKCYGDKVYRCRDIDYDGYYDLYIVEDCGSKDMECRSGSCVSQQCNDECSRQDNYICKGKKLYACVKDQEGCYYLSYIKSCPYSYQVCEASVGNCVSQRRDCPYECCDDDPDFIHKNCGDSDKVCQIHTCVDEKLACPYECCGFDEKKYVERPCSSGYTCKAGSCESIKQECPYECCAGGGTSYEYEKKSCPTGKWCKGTKCINQGKDECDFQGQQCHKGDVYTCNDLNNDGYKELIIVADCGNDETCEDAHCKPFCKTHQYTKCVGNDAYFYNSCGEREQVAESCKENQKCVSGKCQNSCDEGWQCKDEEYKGYLNKDCTWSSTEFCDLGCKKGVCAAVPDCPLHLKLIGLFKLDPLSLCNVEQNKELTIPEPIITDTNIDDIPIIFVHGHSLRRHVKGESIEKMAELMVQFKADFPHFRGISYVKPGEIRNWCEGERKDKKEILIQTSYYYEGSDVNPDISISDYANQIKTVIDTVTGCSKTKVNIVAHSMGGLVAREYVRKHGGDKVNKLITIGTPNHGVYNGIQSLSIINTILDKSYANRRERKELLAQSVFLKRLNEEETPSGPRYYTIAGVTNVNSVSLGLICPSINDEHDGLVCSKSVQLGGANNYEVEGSGFMHFNIVQPDTEVGEEVYKILVSILSGEEIGQSKTEREATPGPFGPNPEQRICILTWCL
jgi:pimeloyl-ACP methyl ester carboxylesterase